MWRERSELSRSDGSLRESRRAVFDRLVAAGIDVPEHLRRPSDAETMPLPWIAKPDRGGSHVLVPICKRPGKVELGRLFYQRWFPTQSVMKVYSVGSRHHVVELRYPTPSTIVDPWRGEACRAPERLADAANAVSQATGLEIFNTDFIDHEGRLLAIDVNPFPALDSIARVEEDLWALIEGDP